MTRRPGDVDQSSEGDWSFNLKQHAETPNLTVELETAELKELSVAGSIQPMTMELSTMDVQFVAPGHTGHTVAEMGRITGESTSVIVDLGDDPPPTNAPASPRPPTATLPSLLKTPPTQNLLNLLPVAPAGPITSRSLAVSTPTRAESSLPPAEEDEHSSGMLLVVVVYLLAAGALGISIYLRFFS